jgi:hypothetical protein
MGLALVSVVCFPTSKLHVFIEFWSCHNVNVFEIRFLSCFSLFLEFCFKILDLKNGQINLFMWSKCACKFLFYYISLTKNSRNANFRAQHVLLVFLLLHTVC